MKHTLIDNTMTLFFEGELNSSNADDVEKDIDNDLEKQTFQELDLDFSKLRYISSAGLRIILRLKQKYDDVHILEASLEIFDVLTMTGFVNIMDVKKAFKVIDVTGAQIIGNGYFSTVYRIDKDTIIKVFNRTSDAKQIERELKQAKQAFILGIPTAISFDIVRVGEKMGVRFEMLDCKSLKDAFLDNPKDYDVLLDKYIKLLKKINTTDCMDPSLPSIHDFYLEKLELIKPYLPEEYYLKAKKLIKDLKRETTFVHGDCHFKNIMVQGDELLLIDMDTLSSGNPIFELAALRAPYVEFSEDEPGNAERFLGVKTEWAQKLYDDIVNGYLGKNDQLSKDKIALVSYIHMIWWNRVNEPQNNVRLEGCKKRLLALLDKVDDLNIEA